MLLWGRVLLPASGPLVTGEAEVFVPHGSEVNAGQHEGGVDLVEVSDISAVLGYLLLAEMYTYYSEGIVRNERKISKNKCHLLSLKKIKHGMFLEYARVSLTLYGSYVAIFRVVLPF